MSRIILYPFLLIISFIDIRTRRIPVLIPTFFGMAALIFYLACGEHDPISLIFSLLPGIVFIALSLVTEGKLGMADALAVLVLGLLMGGWDTAFITLYALFGAAVFSVAGLIAKKIGRKQEIPFLPFLLLGTVIQEVISIT